MRNHDLRDVENHIIKAIGGMGKAPPGHPNVGRIDTALEDALGWVHEMIVDVENEWRQP